MYAGDTAALRAAIVRVIRLTMRRDSNAPGRQVGELHEALNGLFAKVLIDQLGRGRPGAGMAAVIGEILQVQEEVLARTNKDSDFMRGLVYALVQVMAVEDAEGRDEALALFKNIFLQRPDDIKVCNREGNEFHHSATCLMVHWGVGHADMAPADW